MRLSGAANAFVELAAQPRYIFFQAVRRSCDGARPSAHCGSLFHGPCGAVFFTAPPLDFIRRRVPSPVDLDA